MSFNALRYATPLTNSHEKGVSTRLNVSRLDELSLSLSATELQRYSFTHNTFGVDRINQRLYISV